MYNVCSSCTQRVFFKWPAIYVCINGGFSASSLCLQNGVGGDNRAADKGAHVRQSDDRRVRLGPATWRIRVSFFTSSSLYTYILLLCSLLRHAARSIEFIKESARAVQVYCGALLFVYTTTLNRGNSIA